MSKRVGFTLLESLITLGLVLFVFTIGGGLVSEYLQASRFSAGLDRTLEAAQTALANIRCEAGQAVKFSSPAGSGSSGSLILLKVVPVANRLPDPSLPFPGTWNPHDPAWMATVIYTRQENRLLRTQQIGTPVTVEGVGAVARGIADFSAAFRANGNLYVQIKTNENERVRTVSTEIFLSMMR